eukprot:4571872-Prymnesium_polylepis.1
MNIQATLSSYLVSESAMLFPVASRFSHIASVSSAVASAPSSSTSASTGAGAWSASSGSRCSCAVQGKTTARPCPRRRFAR